MQGVGLDGVSGVYRLFTCLGYGLEDWWKR